jgi:BBSome-interacting protein 1
VDAHIMLIEKVWPSLSNNLYSTHPSIMSTENKFQVILPKHGMVYSEEIPQMVLTKPKILPLKSVTLEKIEEMQKQAHEFMKSEADKEKVNDN